MRDRTDQPATAHPNTLWPLGISLVILMIGLGDIIFGQWRRGSIMMGAAMIVAAVLRLVLPRRVAGLLVVRRRWIDVGVLALMGIGIVAMALVVRPGN